MKQEGSLIIKGGSADGFSLFWVLAACGCNLSSLASYQVMVRRGRTCTVHRQLGTCLLTSLKAAVRIRQLPKCSDDGARLRMVRYQLRIHDVQFSKTPTGLISEEPANPRSYTSRPSTFCRGEKHNDADMYWSQQVQCYRPEIHGNTLLRSLHILPEVLRGLQVETMVASSFSPPPTLVRTEMPVPQLLILIDRPQMRPNSDPFPCADGGV